MASARSPLPEGFNTMAGNVKSLQVLFDKLYHDRVVKQSAKSRLRLDKGRLHLLLKQQYSHVNEQYLPTQKELREEESTSSNDNITSKVDRKTWKSKHNTCMPQTKDEVQCVLNDEVGRDPVSETVRMSLKETFNRKHHTRTDGSFKCGNEQKTYSHTVKQEHHAMGKGRRLHQQCEERNIRTHSHGVHKKIAHKAGILLAGHHMKSVKKQKPCSSLFSTSHAGPVRKSIVDELEVQVTPFGV